MGASTRGWFLCSLFVLVPTFSPWQTLVLSSLESLSAFFLISGLDKETEFSVDKKTGSKQFSVQASPPESPRLTIAPPPVPAAAQAESGIPLGSPFPLLPTLGHHCVGQVCPRPWTMSCEGQGRGCLGHCRGPSTHVCSQRSERASPCTPLSPSDSGYRIIQWLRVDFGGTWIVQSEERATLDLGSCVRTSC